MMSIKVTNNGVTRRIPVDDTSSWTGIIERLSDVFTLDTESPELTYIDRDDDVITLSTITELQEAMNDGVKTFCLSPQVSKTCFHYKPKMYFYLPLCYDIFDIEWSKLFNA